MVELRLTPELEAKLGRWSAETGRSADEIVEEALVGYLEELAAVRGMLDGRYDELRSGQVQAVESTQAVSRLREISRTRRAERRG